MDITAIIKEKVDILLSQKIAEKMAEIQKGNRISEIIEECIKSKIDDIVKATLEDIQIYPEKLYPPEPKKDDEYFQTIQKEKDEYYKQRVEAAEKKLEENRKAESKKEVQPEPEKQPEPETERNCTTCHWRAFGRCGREESQLYVQDVTEKDCCDHYKEKKENSTTTDDSKKMIAAIHIRISDINQISKQAGFEYTDSKYRMDLEKMFKVKSSKDLTLDQCKEFLKYLNSLKEDTQRYVNKKAAEQEELVKEAETVFGTQENKTVNPVEVARKEMLKIKLKRGDTLTKEECKCLGIEYKDQSR